MKSRITCVQTANPSLRKDQTELIELMMVQDYSERSKKFYNRFLSDPGVRSRTFGLDQMEQLATETCDESVLRFEKIATELAVRAGRKCLGSAGLLPGQIDGLIITTCTGYLCPGLTSHVGQALGIRPDIFILDIVGHGCGAAVPGLRIADQFLSKREKANVLFIAVEVSATFVHGEAIDLILSNSIFGDGAAACIVTTHEKPGWLMEQHGSLLVPEHREQLRFKTVNSRLNNVLGKDVPQIVARGVKELLALMKITHLPDTLVLHPGGQMLILDTLQKELNINPKSLEASRYVLAEYGNMSSPCVLYILKRWMDTHKFSEGTPALMVSYGAGMSINGACLRWSE